ncbi:MAG: hypothetical protein JEY91_13265 [Spirochaetaceae bacterium]|nr:hypothetical protein [Spirochaetaceae bacterium]
MKKEVLKDFYYEQILLGELNPENYDNEILDKLKESNEDILMKYPPGHMAEKIQKKLTEQNKTTKGNFNYRKIYIPLSAAAVFLLFFAIFPMNRQPQNDIAENDIIRLKGNKPSLSIYRGNADEAELLENNSLVREKDLLQISYDGAGIKYGVIFSIDGRGTVTLHYPGNVYSSTRLDSGGKIFLPFSYELDNAPFFERFFFISSDNEIDAQEIMEKAARIAKGNKSEMLSLPVDFNQQSIILFKEEVK